MLNTYDDYTKKVLQDKYVIDLNEMLGQGAFGEVHRGYMYENKNELIAIKSIDKNKLKKKNTYDTIVNYINREKLNQLQLSGPNIVKMIDFIEDDQCFYFILEFCDQGSLEKKLKYGMLPQKEVFKIFTQIVQGYKEIYDKKIVHRDLKTENILFSKGIAKIGDFGFSKTMDELYNGLRQTALGTIYYIAPEMVGEGICSPKADVWSLGVILYKMLYGDTTMEMLTKKNIYPENPFYIYYPQDIEIPNDYLNLLKKMLTEDPKQRISWDEIFQVILDNDILKQIQESQSILSNTQIKVTCIKNYFFYIQEILQFVRNTMNEVSNINNIIKLSQKQQESYTIISQEYILNELSFYLNILKGSNLLTIQMLPTDFKLFQQSQNYKGIEENFKQNYNYVKESFYQVKNKYEQSQITSQRQSTEYTYQIKQNEQSKQSDCISLEECNKNDQAFGEKFNTIYIGIIKHIKSELDNQANSIQQKQSLSRVLIKLIYCLQPLQFSHRILEPKTIEQMLLNSSNLEIEVKNLYQKYINQEL